MALVYLITFHNADPNVIYLTPMKDLPQSYHLFMKVACFVFLLFNAMQLHFVLHFFTFISYCIFKEFSLVNTRIAKMFDKKNEDTPSTSEIEKVRQHFEDTCSLVNLASEVFKHVIGSCYIASVPVICLMLYGLIHDSLDMEEYLMLPMTMGLLIFMVAVSTLTSVVLNMKAHSSLSCFLMSDFSQLSDRSLHTINTFIMRLTTTNIGYTVYSLFTIDSSTILMLTGTILTYVVVVLQFKTD
ncbi:uncharacterized protein LOC124255508 [Haliotis rubra]|uniref:uncharacterized protein LOC124255508 n=1 Tax=Haliotis rubra TaxID=36100 RepID=UPI001EE50E99|nr:uncharacterized protein LOC124255508 [Haliotis rubra]